MTQTPRKISRRTALKQSALAAATLGLSPKVLATATSKRMGITIASYGFRRRAKQSYGDLHPFRTAIDTLEHAARLGSGGVQIGVRGWQSEFAAKVREKREALNLYLEGQISLPKDRSDLERFESEIQAGKEAGADIIRTVALGGRRYETFKTERAFLDFKLNALDRIRLAEPIVRKHKVRLALENHKDWRAPELVEILSRLSSEWVGVCLDTGNSISLLEDPMEVVKTLAPYTMTIHFKDMGLQEYEEGFLLSEVPFGEGILDLEEIVRICHQANPTVQFNLEMITRDPLKVPCLTKTYWNTSPQLPGSHLAETLRRVKANPPQKPLPRVSGLNQEAQVRYEEANIVDCFVYARQHLNL